MGVQPYMREIPARNARMVSGSWPWGKCREGAGCGIKELKGVLHKVCHVFCVTTDTCGELPSHLPTNCTQLVTMV